MNELKKFINKDNLIGYGSSRIVFDLKDGSVAKIPYNNLGIKANQIENSYYKENNTIIAQILKYDKNILIQEKLDNIVTVPIEYTKENKVKEYLEKIFPNKNLKLIDNMLISRAQVGISRDGKLKFFDYEDSKLKVKLILEPFILDDNWLDMCIKYLKDADLDNIKEWETFEDHRGFLCED